MTRKAAFWMAAIVLIAASSVQADNGRMIVMAASATATTIQIDGRGFMPRGARGEAPVVLMGGAAGSLKRLTLATSTDTTIVAQLPAGTLPGTYRVFIAEGRRDDRRDNRRDDRDDRDLADAVATIDVTIGAVGPMGPIGMVGPIGPMGPIGMTGPAGPQGAQGVQGLAGATGPQGPVGPMGPMGPAGPMGPQGPQGAQGPAGTGPEPVDVPPHALAAAISQEVQPVAIGGLAYVELVTVTTYPHRMELVGVTTLQGKAPISVAENSDAASCPETSPTRPGGLACRQRFRAYYSFDTCKFSHSSILTVRSSQGGADVNIPFTNTSNNWCTAFGVTP